MKNTLLSVFIWPSKYKVFGVYIKTTNLQCTMSTTNVTNVQCQSSMRWQRKFQADMAGKTSNYSNLI